MLQLLLVATVVTMVGCLENGLARTPPMGWLSWERFECNPDCMEEPDDCIGERLLKSTADAMVARGFLKAGYEYVVIDDCWPARDRDNQGNLVGDPKRFPSGMKSLTNYMHQKGLKFGLYEDVGRHTCAGFPGSQGHIEQDAKTFAEWGIDMIKFDGCNADESYYGIGYPEMAKALNKTGRPILYSCEWPLYERAKGVKPNYTQVAETCNSWRVYGDIWDAWESITSIVNYYGDNPGDFIGVAGPGRWNDADMLVIGNYGLSPDQERVQMVMWCMFASSLLISADVRTMRNESLKLLQHPGLIAINQDPLGIPARRVFNMHDGHYQVWTRPLSNQRFAIAYLNTRNEGYPPKFSFNLKQLGLTKAKTYEITDVLKDASLGHLTPAQNLTIGVNPSGVTLVIASPVSVGVINRSIQNEIKNKQN